MRWYLWLLALSFALRANAGDVTPAFFGLHVHGSRTAWPSVPFGSQRLWDAGVSWAELNPSRNVYEFKVLDEYLDHAAAHHVDVVYTFGRTPQWASSAPNRKSAFGRGESAPPSDVRQFDDFVRAIVTHVAGRIHYWEVWNEPDYQGTWTGSVGQMVTLAQHEWQIIKSIDPSAKVLSPGISNPTWLQQYLAAGGAAYTDVIAYHSYKKDADQMANSADIVRTVAARYVASKPIWLTEGGWGENQNLPDENEESAFVAETYTLLASKGIQRFFWYAWNNRGWGTLWDAAGEHPPAKAYNQAYRWLVGATVDCSVAGGMHTCSVERNGCQAEILWNTTADTNYLPLPPGRYYDLAGQVHTINGPISLNRDPIFVPRAGCADLPAHS